MAKLSDIQKREIANEILSSPDGSVSSKTEQFLSSINHTVSNVKGLVKDEDFKNVLSEVKGTVDSVSTIFECAMETRLALKEMDVVLKQMDLTVEKYIQDSNVSLDKFKTTAPIVEKQMDKISDRMDKILDKAISIDAATCAEVDLELRTKLIDQVNDFSDKISDFMLKLMGM